MRLSRNFRGNKHIPADGMAGNLRATSPTSPCLPFRARRELAGSPQARKFAPKQPDFAKIYDFSRATEGYWVRHRDMY